MSVARVSAPDEQDVVPEQKQHASAATLLQAAPRPVTRPFVSVEHALADLAAGRMLLVVDDERRTNVGHLVLAAEQVTPEQVAFMVRYSSGLLRVGLQAQDCQRLGLPTMLANNENPRGTAYTVSVDARSGISTGMSAVDRATTIRLLADEATTAQDLSRPGHVLGVCAQPGGVLRRAGHTEAVVDLTRMAGLRPAAVLAEIVSEWDPRFMAGRAELNAFCVHHDIKAVSIAALVAHRHRVEPQVERVVQTSLPTGYGDFRAVGYRSLADGREHAALVRGEVRDGTDVPVRIHHECLIGDVFRAERCTCRAELDAALSAVAQNDRGVVLYLRGGENLRRCLLQREPSSAPHAILSSAGLVLTADIGDAAACTQMLLDLGIVSVRRLGVQQADVASGPDADLSCDTGNAGSDNAGSELAGDEVTEGSARDPAGPARPA